SILFFFDLPSHSVFFTLSLHDALPICVSSVADMVVTASASSALLVWTGLAILPLLIIGLLGDSIRSRRGRGPSRRFWLGYFVFRSEEHTSELQSRFDLVCRLLLEKKKT